MKIFILSMLVGLGFISGLNYFEKKVNDVYKNTQKERRHMHLQKSVNLQYK